jgi:hypothetical protein
MAVVEVLGMHAADALLAQYLPKPMAKRMQRATLAGVRAMRPFIRAEAPKGATGNLKRSVKARKGHASVTAVAGSFSAVVGPTARYRHLVIRGHRIVGHHTGEGRATTVAKRAGLVDSGRRTRANPFVDRAIARGLPLAAHIATKELLG